MTHRFVIAGAGFTTNEYLPGLSTDGFADAEITVRFADEGTPATTAGSDVRRVIGPDGLDGIINPVSMECRLLDHFRDPDRRAWQLRQMAPIFTTILRKLVLHAGAVEVDGGVIGFVGETGLGKSTLVRFLAGREYSFVADDLLPVRFTPVLSAPVGERLAPIKELHFLRRTNTDSVTIEHLGDLDALQRLARNGFGEHGDSASWAFQFDAYHRIVESVPVFDLTIPNDLSALVGVEEALGNLQMPSAEAGPAGTS